MGKQAFFGSTEATNMEECAMSGSKVYRLVGIALLAAVGFVLQMFLAFPILPGFDFLKLDLSDLTVLIGGLLYGPAGGIMVAFVRSLLHFVMTGGGFVNLIGDGTAFVASVLFMWPPVALMHSKNSLWRQIAGLVGGTLTLTIVMVVLNWLVLMPVYMAVMGFHLGMSLLKYCAVVVVPFNLIKSTTVSIVFFALAKALMPWLDKQHAIQASRLQHSELK
ncbi:membrane protein [Lacticaseibacillus manihotivorans DSM 13343 = JCM 12514]|uniref:Riboflavin transporter n=2 Tax=Lacticaseibacillus manihotivorans TaxID=88233 RepID=A0A0R1Q6M6_9LACO|nr:membrane protein [Lacticaseibacillus manihotivorans DSM 13343 = JCM 12514]